MKMSQKLSLNFSSRSRNFVIQTSLCTGFPGLLKKRLKELTGRKFGWHEDALKDEWSYTGEFSFICVDPETLKCLTAERSNGSCTVSVVFPILSIDDAVQAVEYFLRLVQQA